MDAPRTSTPAVRRSAAAVAVLLAAGLLTLPATADQGSPAVPGLLLLNVGSGKCLTPLGGSTARGAAVVQALCDGSRARQFDLLPAGGSFTVRNSRSGLCLSPAGGGTGPGVAVLQQTCDRDASRAWRVTASFGTASYYLRNVRSGLCLTIGASSGRRTPAVQHSCADDPSRRFTLATRLGQAARP